MRRALALAAVVGCVVPAVAAAFANTEPLAPKQWYLTRDRAWDFWSEMPQLFPIRVAVVDSGIDATNPDLTGRVVAARSFVGGSAYRDRDGHGTFVAGEIAANPANALGIAGMAFNARLVVAKVVRADGTISLPAEVAAIRWAVDQGARVINLSFGGVRDPLDPEQDTYSPLEQAAVAYATSHGVVVVAAVGNGTDSPATPWNYADYPAALPHVIGVSAVARDGTVPAYSNRDAVYDDLAAPGAAIVSTISQSIVDPVPACAGHPWSDCATGDLRAGLGTSFATAQVSAAAALLLGVRPSLTPGQVGWLLERSAVDATPLTGCARCTTGRDAFTGWGTLDVAGALSLLESGEPLPPPDPYEPNDDAGPWSHALPPLPRTISATLDYWDDNLDVYRVRLEKGRRLFARLTPAASAEVAMTLWAPSARCVESLDLRNVRVAGSTRVGRQRRLSYRARETGVYFLALKLAAPLRDPLSYRLSLARAR